MGRGEYLISQYGKAGTRINRGVCCAGAAFYQRQLNDTALKPGPS